MSDDANTDELAYVKRLCPNLSKEEQVVEAARIVPYFRAIPVMVDLPKFQRRADAMSDDIVGLMILASPILLAIVFRLTT